MADTDSTVATTAEQTQGGLREAMKRVLPESRNGRIVTALALAGLVGVPGTLALVLPVSNPIATYAAVFVLPMLATSVGFIVFVIPPAVDAYIVFAGSRENAYLVALLAGVGMALGDLSKYFAGGMGAAAASGKEIKLWPWLRRIVDAVVAFTKRMMDRFAMITLIVMSGIPFNPLVDVAYLSAGAHGISARRFLGAAMIGRIIRSSLLVAFGIAVSEAT